MGELVTRGYLDLKLQEVDQRLLLLEQRLTVKLGAMLAAAVAVVAALTKLL